MKALVIVDLQNDYLPGGAVAVPGADRIIELINTLQPQFDYVVATQDWHPEGHASFSTSHPNVDIGDIVEVEGQRHPVQPPHCQQGTRGAAFADALDTRRIAQVFRKGTDRGLDARSAFFDNGKVFSTGLDRHLSKRGVKDVYLVGVPVEHTIKASALDAVAAGFRTFVITDACRGYEREPGDVERALNDIKRAGAKLIQSEALL